MPDADSRGVEKDADSQDADSGGVEKDADSQDADSQDAGEGAGRIHPAYLAGLRLHGRRVVVVGGG